MVCWKGMSSEQYYARIIPAALLICAMAVYSLARPNSGSERDYCMESAVREQNERASAKGLEKIGK